MTARLLTLPLAIAALFVVGWSQTRDAQPAPVPKESAKEKSLSELLIGKWKETEVTLDGVDPHILGDMIHDFTSDGKCNQRYFFPRIGVLETSFRYCLEGDVIKFPDENPNYSPIEGEFWESTTRIEFLTHDRFVKFMTIQKHYEPQVALKLAEQRKIPLDQVLAEVRLEKWRSVWFRVTDE
jgi:hypothetical protein